MLLERLDVTPAELHAATGWEITAQGACRGDRCVPLTGVTVGSDGRLDVRLFAERMQMPIATDEEAGVWALGPPTGGHVLDSAEMPDLELPSFDSGRFDVASLRGRKVLLLAWASW
jgi:hypothetical protein